MPKKYALRICVSVLVMLGLGPAGALGADAVVRPNLDAGRILRESEPRPAEVPAERHELPLPVPQVQTAPAIDGEGLKVFPVKFRLTGVSLFPGEDIQKILAPYLGQLIGVKRLLQSAEEVTAYYHAKGYIMTFAFIPPQTLEGRGQPTEVELMVMEGRYGKIQIDNQSRVRDEVLRKFLPITEADPVALPHLERGLWMVEDLPGATVSGSNFSAGERPGQSDYLLTVLPEPAVTAMMYVDNWGSRPTGRNRVTAQAAWQSPWGVGDTVDGSVTTSGSGVTTGRAGYSLPLGASGWRASLAASRVSYEVSESYAGRRYFGTADVKALDLSYPVVREGGRNLAFKAGVESKFLRDSYTDVVGVADQDKRVALYTFGLSGDEMDAIGGGGISAWACTAVFGRLTLVNHLARELDQAGHEGSFSRYNFQTSRQQSLESLNRGLGASVSLRSQYTTNNLDSSEKMSISGPSGVRAFPGTEPNSAGDLGWLATVELRQRAAWGNGWNGWASLFYEAGGVKVDAKPIGGATATNLLRGYGVGFGGDFKQRYFMSMSLAKPIGQGSLDPKEDPRGVRGWAMIGVNY